MWRTLVSLFSQVWRRVCRPETGQRQLTFGLYSGGTGYWSRLLHIPEILLQPVPSPEGEQEVGKQVQAAEKRRQDKHKE